MTSRLKNQVLKVALLATLSVHAFGQGTFQNLDFETGVFVPAPTPANPFAVEWVSAMPGWSGYLGANQVSTISFNALSLSTANIAILGPDQPPGEFHGHYYIVLQAGDDPFGGTSRVNSAITQTGTIPSDAQSLRLYLAAGTLLVSFAGQPIPLINLGTGGGASINYSIYGANVSAFAGQLGLLEVRGGGYLDFIQFSNQPIPEPSVLGLFGLGVLLFGWRSLSKRQ